MKRKPKSKSTQVVPKAQKETKSRRKVKSQVSKKGAPIPLVGVSEETSSNIFSLRLEKSELIVGVIPFTFESSLPEELPPEYIQLYSSTAKALFGKRSRILLRVSESFEPIEIIKGKDAKGSIETIPLSFEAILNNSPDILGYFDDYIKKWQSPYDVIVVDLTTQNEQKVVRATVIRSIVSKICETIKKNDCVFIILLKNLYPEDDSFKELFSPELEDKVVIIDDGGEIKSRQAEFDEFDKEQYRVKLAELYDDPIKLVQVKMIRRLGHFKSENKCTDYMYDGTQCIGELTNIFSTYFLQTAREIDQKTYIIYSCPHDHWLENPIITAERKRSTTESPISFEDLLKSKKVKDDIKEGNAHLLIVFPMIDTGSFMEKVIDTMKDEGLLAQNSYQVLAVICSLDAQKTRERVANTNGKEIDFLEKEVRGQSVKYLIELQQKRYRRDAQVCPRCKLGLPESNHYSDEYLMINSYEMWAMVNESGWVPEDDAPPHRGSLNIVPNFEKMVRDYRSWISHKMLRLMDFYQLPPDTIIVYPEGRSIERLTEYLKVLKGYRSIEIPRDVTARITEELNNDDKEFSFEALTDDKENEQWFQDLTYIANHESDLKIIILDSMVYSGQTVKAMQNLLIHFNCGNKIHSVFSLLDFSSDDNGDKIGALSIISLYKIQLHTR